MKTNNSVENQGKNSEIFKVKGNWDKQSQNLKNEYPKLTSEDVKFEVGKETELFKRLETKLDKSRKEVIAILKSNQDKQA